ncbi:MIP/aquaporin family protein [Amycolatopsis jejuensis]|uniref:MIP/aquaporin family protein n=1 Tax=Amycolatopsis jejuensis TaxID=330084 RepID=UPI000526034D|nr:aquaporin [Amycolatopsis jejuensis]
MNGRSCAGEVLGTFAIVLLGTSGVAVAVLFKQVTDLVTMGIIWGGAVAVAVWLSATFSGAHLNPAVTLAFAVAGRHPWSQVPAYWASQLFGAFLGAGTTFLWFGGEIRKWIAANHITVDAPGGERAGLIFAPYSPHPAIIGTDAAAYQAVPIWRGFLVEFIATAILIVFVVIATHRRSANAPAVGAFPIAIGVLVLMLTVATGSLTMTSLNPARDLGPRLLLLLDGYGVTAFPGPRGGLSMLVTVGAPLAAALVIGVFLRRGLDRALDRIPVSLSPQES